MRTRRAAATADTTDLPDDVLDLVLRHVAEQLRVDSTNNTSHRAAVWESLASVCSRWRKIMQDEPVSLTLQYHSGEWDPSTIPHVQLLGQLGRSRVPVVSLVVLKPVGGCPGDPLSHIPSEPLSSGVKQLLMASNFQRYSGPVLQTLTVQLWRDGCFAFTAAPEAYPRLRTLRGVGGRVPCGLPPCLETLEYIAEPTFEEDAADSKAVWDGADKPNFVANFNLQYGSRDQAVAARAVGRLARLRRLTVQRCFGLLPPSFVALLPASIEVATFNECVLAEASTFNATLSTWWAATPQHLQIHEFAGVNYWDTEPEDPPGLVRATFIIESIARLRAQGQYVGPLKLSDDLVDSDSE